MSYQSTASQPRSATEVLGAELAQRHNANCEPYVLAPNPLLLNQASRESNARSYPRRIPLALRRAAGIYVEDVEGRVYIDCLAGAGTLALGHNHPLVIEALQQALREGVPLHTLDLTTPLKDRFIQELFQTLPAQFADHAKVQFCGPTGADAVEAALKLVKTATGRSTMLAFQGAYHGMTHGALMLMGSLAPKRPFHGGLHDVQFLPFPYDYRCPFGLGGEAGVEAGLSYLGTVLNDPESGVPTPAGVILEVIQGEGGVIPAPDPWMAGIRTLTAAVDVPLIVDEVQTGFGRTGRLFAFERSGITPDVVVLSKALGGSLPLSVVVYREGLDCWEPGAHAGTFRGNQLAMAAGAVTLRHLRTEQLHLHAEQLGHVLRAGLLELQSDYPQLGDIRGRGLMIGVEMVDPGTLHGKLSRPAANPTLARNIQAECLRRGLILEVGGRHGSVLRLLPPLILTAAQAAQILEIMSVSLRHAIQQSA